MQNQQEIQLKLSTIFKLKIIDTSQAFGSFYDPNGEKYCAVSVRHESSSSKKIQNGKNSDPEELIQSAILGSTHTKFFDTCSSSLDKV